MLGVPVNFQKNQKLGLENTFLKAARTRAERSWLKRKLVSATLCDQIMGEAIPSRLGDEYNCQVIMTMSVRVDDMKESAALGGLLQTLTKPLCVYQITDGTEERYSFALKRLSKIEVGAVVAEDAHATPEFSLIVPNPSDEAWRSAADFTHIRNRTDKLSVYREWSTRAFIASRKHLYSATDILFDSGGWYGADFAVKVYAEYSRLEQLSRESGKAHMLKDKTRINQETRKILNRLDSLVNESKD